MRRAKSPYSPIQIRTAPAGGFDVSYSLERYGYDGAEMQVTLSARHKVMQLVNTLRKHSPGRPYVDMDRLERALNLTWDAIGDDVLEVSENKIVGKETVIEMCLDADRLLTYGDDTEVARELYACSWETMQELAGQCLPYDNYGY